MVNYQDVPGWLTEEEANLLLEYVNKTTGLIVEVGSFCGRSAVLLASTGRRIICIDPWDNTFAKDIDGEETYQSFLKNTKNLNIVPVRKRIEQCTHFVTQFIYLDGDHSYTGTVAQIEYALKCSPTYIAIHDIASNGGGKIVYDAAVATLGYDYTILVNRLAIWYAS